MHPTSVQVPVPLRYRRVLNVAACGSGDTCVVATDGGVCCWADDREAYTWGESGWSARHRPAPRHLLELDGADVVQVGGSRGK